MKACRRHRSVEPRLMSQLVTTRRLRRALAESEARVQFLVDHWPAKLEDGGITFPDGTFYEKSKP